VLHSKSTHTKYVQIGQSHQMLQQFTYFALAGEGFDRPTSFLSDCFPLAQCHQTDSSNEKLSHEFEMTGENCTGKFLH